MISDMHGKGSNLNGFYKSYKSIYNILTPVIILVCVGALLLSLFASSEGTNSKMVWTTVFCISLAVTIAAVSLNHMLTKKQEYTQYQPELLQKVNMWIFVPLLALAVITLLPFYILVMTSFKMPGEANAPGFTWFPQEGFNWDNYPYVFSVMDGLRINPFRAFVNSMVYALVPSFIGTLVSGFAAYGFAKLHFPGREKIYRFLMFTIMIPGCILTSSSYLFFDRLGWVGTEGYSLPLLVPGCFGGMVAIMFIKEFFMGVPDSIFEAAKIDGAGRIETFFRIALPIAKPAFIAQFIFGVITRYNDYLGPLIYCKYSEQYTTVLALQFLDGQQQERQLLAAAGVFGLLPMLIIYIFFQKKIISGISISSGVKG